MHIVFSAGESYVRYLIITMISILENHPDTHFHFYLLSKDVSASSKDLIDSLKTKYPHFDMTHVKIDAEMFKDVRSPDDLLPIETYFRFKIADLLPDIDKAMYLDVDLVINGDLTPFYDTDLTGYYCAAIKDSFAHSFNHPENINLKDPSFYMNAGVMMMNLDKIRKDNMTPVFFKVVHEVKDKIKFQDQDVLNICFNGLIKEVSSIYNYATYDQKKNPKLSKRAVIVHYVGPVKPWHKKCKARLKHLYFKYKKQSPYRHWTDYFKAIG